MSDTTKDGKSRLSIGIIAEADTAKEAEVIFTARVEKITNLLKAKVPEVDIRSYQMMLNEPPRPWSEPEAAAYTARSGLLIDVDSLESVPAVADEAIAAGADREVSVEFALRDPTKARAEAIYEATKEAKLKAQAEAAALGIKLGPLLKSSVPDSPGAGYRGRGQVTSLVSGDLHVSAEVTLTYSTKELSDKPSQ